MTPATRVLAVLAVALPLAACSSPPSPAPEPGPPAIYQALLHSQLTDLPAGFQAMSGPVQGDPNATDRSHHVIGEVDFPLRGPDAGDQIEMVVFPTAADATADLAHGLRQDPADHVNTGTEPAPGSTVPAKVYDVRVVQGGTTTKAFSHCVATVGNVLVVGSAGVAGNQDRGNTQHACAMTHAGIAHLTNARQHPAATTPSAPAARMDTGPCVDVLFVGVRGSREDAVADAGMGSTVYALYGDLRRDLPATTSLLGKGLPYPANVLDSSGVPPGITTLAGALTDVAHNCPHEQVVVVGYSLGAQVVGDAVDQFGNSLPADVRAVVLLADPRFNPADPAVDQGTFDPKYGPDQNRRQPYPAGAAARVRSYCRLGDPICQGFQQPGADKVHHGEYVPQQTCAAAAFIEGTLGMAPRACH